MTLAPDEPPMAIGRVAKMQVAERYLKQLFSADTEAFMLVVSDQIPGTDRHAFDCTSNTEDGFLKATIKHISKNLKVMKGPLPWGRRGGEPL